MTDQNTRPTPSSDVAELIRELRESGDHYGIPMERTCARAADALERFSASPAQVVKPLEWEPGVVDWARPFPGMKYVACSTTPAGAWAWWLEEAPETRDVFPSEVEAKAAAQADYESRILSALTPAQVEVTDEMVERFIQASSIASGDTAQCVRAALTAALTATDAKPVSHEHIEVTDAGLQGFAEWFRKNYPGPDTLIHKPDWHSPKIYRAALHHARKTDAKPVERLSADDFQMLVQVRDRRNAIIEESNATLQQAFALSDRGLLALEQLPSGADLHITRKGRKAIDAALASEGKTDA